MTRPPLASQDDLERLLGASADDPLRALALLENASAIVRAYAGLTWLNDDETDLEDVPADIPGVVAGMVERATRNPSGTVAESAGPFSRSFGPDAAQRLYMTSNEKLVIRAAAGRGTVGTIQTSRGPVETPPVRPGFSSGAEDTLAGITGLMGGS